MSKKKKKTNLYKTLVVVTVVTWIFTIIAAIYVIRVGGHLKPKAAGLDFESGTRVVVVDQKGKAIGGARLTLRLNNVNNYVTVDKNGQFNIVNLVSGRYYLEINAPGFNNFSDEVLIEPHKYYTFTLSK